MTKLWYKNYDPTAPKQKFWIMNYETTVVKQELLTLSRRTFRNLVRVTLGSFFVNARCPRGKFFLTCVYFCERPCACGRLRRQRPQCLCFRVNSKCSKTAVFPFDRKSWDRCNISLHMHVPKAENDVYSKTYVRVSVCFCIGFACSRLRGQVSHRFC